MEVTQTFEGKPTHEVYLIRHTQVDTQWKGRCYGQLDVELSREGMAAIASVANTLSEKCISTIMHSGLRRAELLAQAIANEHPSAMLAVDTRLAERNYGDWEGMTWDSIYAADPEFHNLIYKPREYRPPRGETTFEMQSRVMDWWNSLTDAPVTVVVSHSGPIASLCGSLLNLDATKWEPWMLATGQGIKIIRSAPPNIAKLSMI